MRSMRSKLVPLVLAHVSRAGGDAQALADRFAIPEALRDPDGWTMDAPALRVDVVAAVLDAAAEMLDEPLLGIRVALELPRGAYGVLEHAVRNAPTLRDAATRLVRYQRLINDAVCYELEEDDRETVLVHRLPGHPDGVSRHGNLLTLSLLDRFVRQLADPGPRPRRVELAHGPADHAALREVFGDAALRFSAGRNALAYGAADFDRPVRAADASLLQVLDGYAERLLPTEDPAATWAARVRDHLRRALSGGAPTLDEMAALLHTSARNLQRQLSAEDTSYSGVLEGLREERARALVADPTIPLGEVAFLLGYSDGRALLRAFKRWTGRTPRRYREGALA